MSEKLLPCPFCGGPAGEVGLEFVTCLSAEVGTEQTCPGKQIRVDVEDAESWNTRSGGAPAALDHGGKAVIEGDAVVIRFPLEAMQSALDGAWSLNVFDRRQKVTDKAEFAKEFCRELNAESENGTTLIHRMADKAFVNMLEGGAFGFDEHEEQSL